LELSGYETDKMNMKMLFNRSAKKLPYKDAFLDRLPSSTISGGMLRDGNLYLMDHAIKNMPVGGHVLEIGCWAGLSTNVLLHMMKKYSRKELFFACDPWIYEGYNDFYGVSSDQIDGNNTVSRLDFMNYIRTAYINAVALFNQQNLPHTFRLTSDEFFKNYSTNIELTDIFNRSIKPGGDLSFCYIDGDHSYEAAKKDFENVDRFLKINGFILFDDSVDGSAFGSSKLMEEIKKNKSYRIVEKNPNYLVQKIS
jgi:hypothetical protein